MARKTQRWKTMAVAFRPQDLGRSMTIALRIMFGVLLAVVTHQSLVPSPASVFEHWSDKFLHLGAWMVVAIAMSLAFPKVKPIWRPYLLLFGYATSLEFGQILVPGRVFSGLDIIANGLGCGVVLVFRLLWNHYRAMERGG